MRALLVVNPKATTTSERVREVLVGALRSEVDLEVEHTGRRGHAAELARRATEEHYDLVVTLGGDGTINEVVNGLLHDGPGDKVPALAVVPGGSTNVFARSLGLPRDSIEGTGAVLEALHADRARTISLGRAGDRYFTFCAGFGLDAQVVRAVERARLRGRVSTPMLYIRSAVTEFLLETDRHSSLITLERPDAADEPSLATVIVQNTAPWTYLGDRAVNPCPDASFETGLDLIALRVLHLSATVRLATQLLTGRPVRPSRHTLNLHDLDGFTVRAARALPCQLDGDYIGDTTTIRFTSVPGALRVFC